MRKNNCCDCGNMKAKLRLHYDKNDNDRCILNARIIYSDKRVVSFCKKKHLISDESGRVFMYAVSNMWKIIEAQKGYDRLPVTWERAGNCDDFDDMLEEHDEINS